MQYIRPVSSLFCLLVLFASCSKKAPDSGTTLVSFTLPQEFQNGALAFNETACYAVNISGPNIDAINPGSCDGSYGTFSGLSSLGQTITVEANSGTNRTIDFYYVISTTGCSQFNPANGLGATYGGNKVFRVGQRTGVDFDKPEVVVEIQLEYASSSNNLRSLLGLPSSCDNGNDPIFSNNRHLVRLIQGKTSGTTTGSYSYEVRLTDKKLPAPGVGTPGIEPSLPLGDNQ